MSTPANAKIFEQPLWRVIAPGFDTERWLHDGQAVGTGGIANPQPTRLPAGHSTTASPAAPRRAMRSAAAAGGWTSKTSRSFAALPANTATRCARRHRLMLALPYAWTRVDLQVRALLRERVHRPGQASAGL